MIDHISVGVSELERAAEFYEATLAALGLARLVTRPRTIGFGKAYPEFWINLREAMAPVAPESGVHICLRAKTTAEVDAFHAAALATGGASDGATAHIVITAKKSPGAEQAAQGAIVEAGDCVSER